MNATLEWLAGLNPLAGLSWNGNRVYGDEKSIQTVRHAISLAAIVPLLHEQINMLEMQLKEERNR